MDNKESLQEWKEKLEYRAGIYASSRTRACDNGETTFKSGAEWAKDQLDAELSRLQEENKRLTDRASELEQGLREILSIKDHKVVDACPSWVATEIFLLADRLLNQGEKDERSEPTTE